MLVAARSKGHSESQLVSAGLAVRREDSSGCYDRFRDRLIFPILDPTGRVVAFGGRAMGQAERAKYINSPESPLFDKSGQLYGLNWARESIVSTGRAVVVEGYMDALMPMQHGIDNVVATMGTSLTDRHARLLGRYAQDVVLVFDADAAGQAAAQRALELFLAQQLQVRVATVPAGKDPCDFCLAEGAEAMNKLVDEAPDALQYVWDRRLASYRAAGGNLADRRRFLEEFLQLVVSSATYGAIDEVRRGQLAQHIGHMLNIPPADLQQQMRRLARRVSRSSQPTQAPAPAAQTQAGLAEQHVLEVVLNRPDLFDLAAERIDPEDFGGLELRTIAENIWRLGHADRLNLNELLAIEALSPYGSLLATLTAAGEHRANYEQTLTDAIEHIVYRRTQQEVEQMKSDGLCDDEKLRQLGEQLRKPDSRRHPRIA